MDAKFLEERSYPLHYSLSFYDYGGFTIKVYFDIDGFASVEILDEGQGDSALESLRLELRGVAGYSDVSRKFKSPSWGYTNYATDEDRSLDYLRSSFEGSDEDID
jgi:hypothetical protein